MGSPRFVFVTGFLLVSGLILAQSGTSSSSRPKAPHPVPVSTLDPGGVSDGVYRNLSFVFSYKIPFGWVERTQDMQGEDADGSKSRVLLAIFERPPDAPGNTVNSAVVIAAEKASNYPGLKAAADYFGPLDQLAKNNGFKSTGDHPYEFALAAKKLARGDYVQPLGGEKNKLTMQQSTLVELERGYLVSFTFVAGSEDEVENLIGNLSFATQK